MQCSAPPSASPISERKRQPGETADDYPHVVVQLSDGWRVIRCAANLQWIIQSNDGERAGRARWAGVGYCMTREALLQASRALCARIDPAALAALGALPEHITVARVTAPAPVNDKLAALTGVTTIDNDNTADARRRDWLPGPEFVGQ